jgi:hypothetical protein
MKLVEIVLREGARKRENHVLRCIVNTYVNITMNPCPTIT